jgi:hypothetical protein
MGDYSVKHVERRDGAEWSPATFTVYSHERCDSCGHSGPALAIGKEPTMCLRCLEAAAKELRRMATS